MFERCNESIFIELNAGKGNTNHKYWLKKRQKDREKERERGKKQDLKRATKNEE